MTSVTLSLNSVNKIYGSTTRGVYAVRDLSFKIDEGEIVALLGSSGCGKTSTLRMIAGFEAVSSGTIELAGRPIHQLPPAKRNVAMAFEGYSLYPPLSIRQNIAFALKALKLSNREVNERVESIADLLQIGDILERLPSSISAGQQQRASLARALIRPADLHLLDEPMGQLEPQLRTLLRGRIKHYMKSHGQTAILVTHDQAEANALSDRIAVMSGGVLQQFDTPKKIRDEPVNLFTGGFVGEPPMNMIEARAMIEGDRVRLAITDQIALNYAVADAQRTLGDLTALEKVVIGIRPHSVRRSAEGMRARVTACQWIGDQTHIAVEVADRSMVFVEHHRSDVSVGDEVTISAGFGDLHFFDPATGNVMLGTLSERVAA